MEKNMNYYYRLLNNYYLFCWQEWEKIDTGNQSQGKKAAPTSDRFFEWLQNKTHFDKKPSVLTDRAFNNLDAETLYCSAGKFDSLAGFVIGDSKMPSNGYLSGLLCAKSKQGAENFKNFGKPSTYNIKSKAMKFKMDGASSCKKSDLEILLSFAKDGIDSDLVKILPADLKERLFAFNLFLNKIPRLDLQKRFYKLFSGDLSKFAMFLGFDEIIDDKPPFEAFSGSAVLLNGSKVKVSESEFNRVCLASSKYKNFATSSFGE